MRMNRTIKQDVPDRNPRTRQIISVDGEGWNIPLTDDVACANPSVSERGWHSYVMLGAADDQGFARSLVHDGSRREATPDTARNYGLTTRANLEFLLNLPRNAMVISFAFSYDQTKLIADLPLVNLRELARESVADDGWKAERLRRMEAAHERFGFDYEEIATMRLDTFNLIDASTTIYENYWIAYTPRKMLRIVDLEAGKTFVQNFQDGKPIGKARKEWARSVTVWDAFGYFQKSFVKALQDYRCGTCAACVRAREHCKAKCSACAETNYCLTAPWTPDDIRHIAKMKEQRGVFKPQDQKDIVEYCLTECRYLSFLFRDLYVNIDEYDTNIRRNMTRFDGTGSVAAAWMKVHEVKKSLPERVPGEAESLAVSGDATHNPKTCELCKDDASKHNHCSACGETFANSDELFRHLVNADAKLAELPEIIALSAYFGGRFEITEIGYMGDLHGYDINSAYPHIMRTLPCLAHGRFVRVKNYVPGKFGVYLVGSRTAGRFAPFPYRTPVKTDDGTAGSAIYYAHGGKRWIWSNADPALSELATARKHHGNDAIPIYDGYVWEPECDDPSPFAAIPEMYAIRQEYVTQGNGVEKVIKLILNSLYGKTAQSIGWAMDKDGIPHPPPFQCFIWAGLITSGCRAMILDAVMHPDADVVSIATDGILSRTPIDLDAPKQKILGKWDYTPVEDGYLFQSGVYTFVSWNKYDQKWKRTYKTRGFSAKEIPAEVLIAEWRIQNRRVIASPDASRFVPLRSGVTRNDALDYIGQWVPSIHDVAFNHSRRIPEVLRDEYGDIADGLERYSHAVEIGCGKCERCHAGNRAQCDEPPLSMPYEPRQSWADVLDEQWAAGDMDYLDHEPERNRVPHE